MKPSETVSMTSGKPYLIRALHEWISDNGMTPYIVVDAAVEHIKIPFQYVKENKITLSISMSAALHLQIQNDFITFSARFSGVLTNVVVPVRAVLAIYAKETGKGMVFEPEDTAGPSGPVPPQLKSAPAPAPVKGKPHLKLVD